MQTIARANRVFPEKNNGLIVDYIGVFRDLQKALAIYAASGTDDEGAFPVKDKSELLEWLRATVEESLAFCRSKGVDIDTMLALTGFALIAAADDAVEHLIVDDDTPRPEDPPRAVIVCHQAIYHTLPLGPLPMSS